MPRRLPLFVRGLWWRRGLTAAVLVVATLAIGAAALGPIYAHAAGESTLRDELTAAPSNDSGLHFQIQTGSFSSSSIGDNLTTSLASTPTPGQVNGYPQRIEGLWVGTSAHPAAVSAVKTALLWRTGICAHVVIVSGSCPTQAGQLMISARTVAQSAYGWRMGVVLNVGDGLQGTVTGVYTPHDLGDPFWFGTDYFDAGPGTDGPDTVDATLVAEPEFALLPPRTPAVISIDFPLAPDQIRLADVAALRHAVAALQARSNADTAPPLSTNIGQVLDAAAHQKHLVSIGTLLVTLQLSVLAWLVLFEVIADAIESRGSEIALAKLRGLRPWATIRFGLGESVALLVLALPLSLGVAWIAAQLLSASVLAPHTPIVLTPATGWAMLAALAGGAGAAAAAGYRTLTRPVLSQWRRTTGRPRPSRIAIGIDVGVAAAALVGLVLLRVQHHAGDGNDTAALLAPGLLVIAVALIGTRLLPIAARALLPITRASTRIGLFLAARHVVRRPAGLRLAALLAVAVGLATFAVCGEAVAAHNRGGRAQAELGASRVVSMQFQPGADPIDQVREADPDGRWAMAAATWLPDGGQSVVGTVLAVDSSRLARVAYPAPGGPALSQIASTIGASTVPVVKLTSGQLRASITATALSGPAPDVQFTVRTLQKPFINVSAGRLRSGTHDYVATLDCPSGCTLLGITLNRPIATMDPMRGQTLLTAVAHSTDSGWTPLDLGLTRTGSWRAGPESGGATDTVRSTPAGLRDDYASRDGGYGAISYAYSPSPMPAVATTAALSKTLPNPPELIDGLNIGASFALKRTVSVLPAVLDQGIVLDLTFLRAQLPAFDSEANWQVWLGPHAPADAMARLRAAGLVLGSSQTEHSRVIALGRQGPALSLFLLLACAIVGSVLAVGGTAISISASARRRSFEMAALRTIGVRSPTLYRAGLLEQLLLLGTAVVLGLPAGILAARLAMPVIPEFADTTPIALSYTPAPGPIVVFAAAFIVIVGLSAAVASYAVLHGARPARLREAEE